MWLILLGLILAPMRVVVVVDMYMQWHALLSVVYAFLSVYTHICVRVRVCVCVFVYALTSANTSIILYIGTICMKIPTA